MDSEEGQGTSEEGQGTSEEGRGISEVGIVNKLQYNKLFKKIFYEYWNWL